MQSKCWDVDNSVKHCRSFYERFFNYEITMNRPLPWNLEWLAVSSWRPWDLLAWFFPGFRSVTKESNYGQKVSRSLNFLKHFRDGFDPTGLREWIETQPSQKKSKLELRRNQMWFFSNTYSPIIVQPIICWSSSLNKFKVQVVWLAVFFTFRFERIPEFREKHIFVLKYQFVKKNILYIFV